MVVRKIVLLCDMSKFFGQVCNVAESKTPVAYPSHMVLLHFSATLQ